MKASDFRVRRLRLPASIRTSTVGPSTMTYALSDNDRLLVARTTEHISAEAMPRIIRIHEKMIAADEERRAGLLREIEAIDRAIAMRRASLAALVWRLAAQTDRSDG